MSKWVTNVRRRLRGHILEVRCNLLFKSEGNLIIWRWRWRSWSRFCEENARFFSFQNQQQETSSIIIICICKTFFQILGVDLSLWYLNAATQNCTLIHSPFRSSRMTFFTNIFTIPRDCFYNNYMEVYFFQVVIIISVFSKPLQKPLFSQYPDYR